MNIREALLAEHSKRQTLAIADYIGGDSVKFAELVEHFLGPIYRVSQRAAGAVNVCNQRDPELVKPYLKRFVEQLENSDQHPAVRRNITRLLQFVEIPPRLRGRIFEVCYDLVDSGDEPVAVRVFALTTAANIAKDNPELLAELKLLAEKHVPNTTAAFRTRVKNVFSAK